jgi:hypothetical protein
MVWLIEVYLCALVAFVVWLFDQVFGECSAATRLKLRIKREKMAYNIGEVKFLSVVPDGALDPNAPITLTSSDEAVCSIEAVEGNPFKFKLTFLATGSASLTANATSSDGTALSASLDVEVAQPAATKIGLIVSDE